MRTKFDGLVRLAVPNSVNMRAQALAVLASDEPIVRALVNGQAKESPP